MKRLLFLICVTALFTTTGCIVPEGDHHDDRGHDEGRHDDHGGPPDVVVRPPEVIVR